MADEAQATDVVLVGGGHAHVQVLRRFMMRPVPDVRLCVVLDRPVAVYSGMVPGFVAGDYPSEALAIDVVPLARRARARVILAAATRVDPVARRIELEGRPPITYDVASLDVGSSVRGLELPGVREHALATRPIGRFVSSLEERLAGARQDPGTLRIAVVGGGVAGVELACALDARLRREGLRAQLSLFSETPELLPGMSRDVTRRVEAELRRRSIVIHRGSRVVGVEKDALLVSGAPDAAQRRMEIELALWATGAAPPEVIHGSPLPFDAAGFVRTLPTLQVEGFDDLFAVGDCAGLEDYPWVRKAGVYAVRAGPVLDANLRALLEGRELRPYRPQRDFLALFNLGERRALGTKWGRVLSGRAVWHLKDRIDRRFMRRFQVLDDAGGLATTFPTPEAMGMEEMACGGCAAKVAASPLERALERLPPVAEDPSVLLGVGDDAAAFSLPRGDVVLATVDGFRAFADDPWLVGRVAAVNAVSDVLAKGGRARHALALVNVPDEDPARAEESLFQVLSGIRAALDPLEIALVGGHTTQGGELFVGLTVTGTPWEGSGWIRLDGSRPGDALILTKALGTGVVLAADMQGRARGAWVQSAYASMLRHNAAAAQIARAEGVRACTDISGFGLAGHLVELVRASGVSARIGLERLPALPGAIALLESGTRSSYHEQNAALARAIEAAEGISSARRELFYDPQTSGGLLLSVDAERAEAILTLLQRAGDSTARIIGQVERARSDGVPVRLE